MHHALVCQVHLKMHVCVVATWQNVETFKGYSKHIKFEDMGKLCVYLIVHFNAQFFFLNKTYLDVLA